MDIFDEYFPKKILLILIGIFFICSYFNFLSQYASDLNSPSQILDEDCRSTHIDYQSVPLKEIIISGTKEFFKQIPTSFLYHKSNIECPNGFFCDGEIWIKGECFNKTQF